MRKPHAINFVSAFRPFAICSMVTMSLIATNAGAQSKDLGNGFRDLGVAAPISNHRGTVTTVDGNGRNVVLSYIMDSRGGYALLMVDAETGKTDQFAIPFNNSKHDSPYASILSSANKFYTHFGDYFVEFDPAKRAFTFSHKTTPQMSMGMTEDDNGLIWSVSYPQSGVVSFDPKTRQFKDYGNVYKQNWPQYQRFVAADDAGWIYFALGMTATQIVAFDPATSTAKPMLQESERHKGGTAYVYRDQDGKVYGQAEHVDESPWYELYKGQVRKINTHAKRNPKPIITDSQVLLDRDFPDGSHLDDFNLVDRKLTVTNPKTSDTKTLSFDYSSEGAMIMALAAASDGTISGGTAFPMRAFSYNPKTDKITNRMAHGQWNTVTSDGDKFFVGGYPSGYMLEWDPKQPWVPTVKGDPKSNPLFLQQVTPVIHRPHSLLALADKSAVIMGGTPEYGYTGGGLLFWDRQAKKATVIKDTDIVPDQSTHAMVELPGGKLLAGTTTDAGTGGEKKATQAEIYTLDLNTKKVLSHSALIPGVAEYTALCNGPDGLVYGFADRHIFFVYDPAKGAVIQKEDISKTLGPCISPQGPRVFVKGGNKLYVLLLKGIAELNTTTHKLTLLAQSPVELEDGGDYLDGKIYFAKGSHLYSWQVPQ